jgi:hypothetical protein
MTTVHIALGLANLALVVAFSTIVLSLLRIHVLPAYLVGLYIVAYADIVLILEAAGLTNVLRWQVVTALQVLLTGLALVFWWRAARPRLLAPFSGLRPRRLVAEGRPLLTLIPLGIVAAGVGYAYLREAQLILSTLPSNFDALTYHLSRVGYWMQYQSLYPWPTPDPRQTTFPMNAELGVMWTILWWGTDRLSGFVQWSTVPVIMLAVYGLTRLLGYSRWQGAFTALLWATLAQVLYQSSTTQNDLVTAAFWMATVYFFYGGLRESRPAHYGLSGVAFGLAMGTKGTSLFVLPGFGFAVLVVTLVLRRQRAFRRYLIGCSIAFLIGFVLFGSYIYVQNTIAFGRPFGPPTSRTGARLLQPDRGILTYAVRLRDNLARYAYQFVDFSPLPSNLASDINPIKAAVFSRVFEALRVRVEDPETIALPGFDLQYVNPLDENKSWFGPLAILLIPAAMIQAYQVARTREVQRLGLLVTCAGFLVVQSALEQWTPYKGRYYLIPVAMSFPLMACFLQTRTAWRALLASGLVILGMAAMFGVLRHTPAFEHIGWRNVFSEERKAPAWPTEFQYLMVQRIVPEDAAIGLTGGLNFRDYPFFGEHFTHYVTLAVPDDRSLWPRADVDRFVEDFRHSAYLLVDRGSSSRADASLQGFDQLIDDGRNSLWVRKGQRLPAECDGDKWPFTDFYRSSPDIAACPQFPLRLPQTAAGGGTAHMSGDRFVPVVGSGAERSLKFNLLVKNPTRLIFSVQLGPHPHKVPQSLQLLLSAPNSEPRVYAAPFGGKGVVRFSIPLQPNTYTAELGLADGELEVAIRGLEVSAQQFH